VFIKKKYLKNIFLKNHWARKAEIYMTAFRQSTKANLNHGPRGSGGATIEKIVFTCVYIGELFSKSSSREPLDQKSLDLHESFKSCIVQNKFVKSIALGGRMGVQ
jgi:hypothetical protein